MGLGPGLHKPHFCFASWLPVGLARVGAQGRLRQVGGEGPASPVGPYLLYLPMMLHYPGSGQAFQGNGSIQLACFLTHTPASSETPGSRAPLELSGDFRGPGSPWAGDQHSSWELWFPPRVLTLRPLPFAAQPRGRSLQLPHPWHLRFSLPLSDPVTNSSCSVLHYDDLCGFCLLTGP